MKTKKTHHLFSLSEIRIRLVEMLGEPKTAEEKQILEEKAQQMYQAIPVFTLTRGEHRKLHQRLRYAERINKLLRKRLFTPSQYHAIKHMLEQSPEK